MNLTKSAISGASERKKALANHHKDDNIYDVKNAVDIPFDSYEELIHVPFAFRYSGGIPGYCGA